MNNLSLYLPFDKSTIVQSFGANQVNYQVVSGTDGHPGIDFDMPYGTPIPNCCDQAVVSCILSEKNPDLMQYRAVNTIIDLQDFSYEIQYGHCSAISTKVPNVLNVGDILGQVGNTGAVFANGVQVTAAEKNAGSTVGSHLHFQVRVLKKVPVSLATDWNAHWINDGSGRLVLNGYCYEVVNYNNGYHGCVDPAQFFNGQVASNTASAPVQGSLQDIIKEEVLVLNQTTDPVVRQSFIKLIIAQAKKYLFNSI